ncbi:uncharacterized protein (DUF58 family) [Halarchaeum rubridurum]|uniref:Uncharacterized protein (DUF58 family) n=1 Tax=Halarchaeum rubridurum TaxID=489911 RepID=A0A830G179_9EURY|nr:DUF58 domain-containing protein [Halarchaeum rubridurum]MBP1954934.1 uncharacterized protein (DUF58 family) [Halarchaeum rubridurum]GGM70248.1 hypothetical protein GCM10009017_20560 [Halarchaeum rubridurum]
MRPTGRGVAVVAVALAGFVSARAFGTRSLNAVVVPAVCVFLLAALVVARADAPRVVRDPPADGFPGDDRRVSLAVRGDGALVTVRDALGTGLDGDGVVRSVADGREGGYDVTLRERGRHAVGPATVVVSDPFGLWRRSFAAEGRDEVVVYPSVVPLGTPPRALAGAVGTAGGRSEFAGVREYVRGDPLRDVNWKASAKRPDEYLVTTYAGDGSDARVVVAVDVREGGDPDRAAVAAASVVVACLDAGVAVGLRTPNGTLAPASDAGTRRRALELLADLGRAESGSDAEGARVVVCAGADGVTVSVDGETRPAAELLGEGRA